MSKSTINIKVDESLKTAAEAVFTKLGLTLTSAINLYLHQVVRVQGIPFPLDIANTSQLSTSALDLEKSAQQMVAAMICEAKTKGLPVVRYDPDLEKCYLEYPDETRDYDCINE